MIASRILLPSYAPVAQPGLECFPPKEKVAGSNPARSVDLKQDCRRRTIHFEQSSVLIYFCEMQIVSKILSGAYYKKIMLRFVSDQFF